MFLLLPLLSSVLYVFGALFLKQTSAQGVDFWRISFVANLICGVSFSVLWPLGGALPPWSLWWQPAVVAALFVAGQALGFLAIARGDVSVATPVLGVKVVLVAFFVTMVIGERVPGTLWLAAALSSAGILFLNRGGGGPAHHAGSTILIGSLAAAAYALFDVLVQKWAPVWGAGRFIPVLMWTVAAVSLSLMPFFHAPLAAMPRPARRTLAAGSAFIAAQGIFLISALAVHGEATAINVIYSLRGLWSVLLVWTLGHWFDNQEHQHGRRVLVWRLVGAGLLTGAVMVVVLR